MSLGNLALDFNGAEITSAKLLTEKEIVDSCVCLKSPDVTGVYFLAKGGEVVYVGQSMNVFKRIASHVESMDVDGFCYIRCSPKLMDTLESIYIHFLQPKNNSGSLAGKNAPLRFDAVLSKISIKNPDVVADGIESKNLSRVMNINELMKVCRVGLLVAEGRAGLARGQVRRWLNGEEPATAEGCDAYLMSVIDLAIESGSLPEDCHHRPMAELIEVAKRGGVA